MSIIKAYDNLIDNQWDFIEENISSHYADLKIGFTKNEPIVEFKNLKFGFELKHNDEIIDSKNWPPENIKYRRTDQVFLVTHRLSFKPGLNYVLRVWAENDGVFVEGFLPFSPPIPVQPFESWVWQDFSWVPPVSYPEDGGFYVWDEDSVSWVEEDVE